MAITDRYSAPISVDELEQMAALDPAPARDTGDSRSGGSSFPLSTPGRVLLATLSATAGVIHLAMVPSHAAEWLPEGIAFAAAGWLQIGLAVVFLTRPSRAVLGVSGVANTVFVGAWAVSRLAGSPLGPEAGQAHAASFVDITCVVLETLLVIAGLVLLVRPEQGARARASTRVVLSAVPIAILLLATAAIASPSAANHAHAGGTETASGGTAGAGHSHDPSSGSTPTTGADGHAHSHDDAGATPVDDKGLSLLMNGQGDGGGHSHEVKTTALDPATQRQLDEQLAATKVLVDKYPTVKDAEAGGWNRAGPYSPGLGAHYTPTKFKLNADGKIDPDDIEGATLIYDGIAPDSKLAGFMYNIMSVDTQNPPEGFAGSNDQWHYHTNVCIVRRPGGGIDSPLGADTSAPKELCDKYGGMLIANTGYMVHVWTVPGYESSQGVFSNVNPKLTCSDGTYHVVKMEEIGNRTNVCRNLT